MCETIIGQRFQCWILKIESAIVTCKLSFTSTITLQLFSSHLRF